MEPGAIKKEAIDVNEVVEELNYNHERPIKSEFIEQEELQIKYEEDNEDVLKSEKTYDSQCPSIQQKGHITSKEDKRKLNKNSPKPVNQLMLHQCPECPYMTTFKAYFKRHSTKHKKPEEIIWYNCQECPYRVSKKCHLKKHIEVHDRNKLRLKHSKYSYETSTPLKLKRHQEENETAWHKCLECSFKTLYKQSFQRHVLAHKPQEKLNKSSHTLGNRLMLHQCSECSYKTFRKGDLKRHIDIHNRKTSILKCSSCSYETWRQSDLKRHQIWHQGENGMGWHRCMKCSYKTPYKATLQKHLISHKSDDEIQWFECSQCTFKTPYKSNLGLHQIKHEVGWLSCYECGFKTKYKPNLVRHNMLKHKK